MSVTMIRAKLKQDSVPAAETAIKNMFDAIEAAEQAVALPTGRSR